MIEFHLEADPDIVAVVSFMQERLTAERLIPVAEALASLAPALWGHLGRSELRALSLAAISPQSASTTQ